MGADRRDQFWWALESLRSKGKCFDQRLAQEPEVKGLEPK
jgi:hypothetical protein